MVLYRRDFPGIHIGSIVKIKDEKGIIEAGWSGGTARNRANHTVLITYLDNTDIFNGVSQETSMTMSYAYNMIAEAPRERVLAKQSFF